MMRLMQAVPEFIAMLDETQKRVLSECVKREITLKWFWAAVNPEQIREFERRARGEQEAEEIAKVMHMVRRGDPREEQIVKVLDYKTEMCSMIDNISNVEVFRSIDVDMPDSYISNLQLN